MSCFSQNPSEKEMQSSLDKASFETKIISDFPLYEDLNTFLEINLDTIINHSRLKTDFDQHAYIYLNLKEDIPSTMQIPEFLNPKLDSLISDIGRNNIESISIYKDSSIKFEIKCVFIGNDIYIYHELVCGDGPERLYGSDFEKFKDSIINKNCTYRIGIWVDWGF